MLYNSLPFFCFLVVTAFFYRFLPYLWQRPLLLFSSYFFYFSWSPTYTLLLVLLTLIAYGSARLQKTFAFMPACSITFFLFVLGYFKYSEALLGFLRLAGLQLPASESWNILIPVGISYYLFRIISYVLDVYWGKIPPEKDFLYFASYVSFFPHMLSGPIQRGDDFLSQIKTPMRIGWIDVEYGLGRIFFGLFKKLVVADRLALYINPAFASPHETSGQVLLIASYAFALQLYADFSGIIDIAIGSARLFGIRSPENFDSPFYAPNIQIFWRKWNMTLSFWLRDYLFTPLHMGLRSLGNQGLHLCVFINMLAIGIWHGPKWTYLAFGLIHSVYISLSVLTLTFRENFFASHLRLAVIRKFTAPLITFHLVVLSFVFFRASDIREAIFILRKSVRGIENLAILMHRMLTTDRIRLGHLNADILICLMAILLMEAFDWGRKNEHLLRYFEGRSFWWRWPSYWALLMMLLLFSVDKSYQFIYFQF